MQKTKNFFQKSLQNIRNFLFGSYDKIPRTLFLNPLSCSSINQRSHHLDQIYPDFFNCNQSSVSGHTDRANADSSMKQFTNTDAHDSTEPIRTAQDTADETAKQIEGPKKNQPSTTTSTSFRYAIANGDAYLLAQKMKELDMMDVRDVDHTLDVEEALHYYSRLTCPEYVDIVNKFFMDMYADFHLPQPSISISSSSSRRLGPLAL
uniref:Uncharacterized protein n=2 Tax=Chenopodium quinoa TaxID=63459 RepID=A0A803LND1_CHEQI